MKKVFAFILVLCMVLSCVPTFAEPATSTRAATDTPATGTDTGAGATTDDPDPTSCPGGTAACVTGADGELYCLWSRTHKNASFSYVGYDDANCAEKCNKCGGLIDNSAVKHDWDKTGNHGCTRCGADHDCPGVVTNYGADHKCVTCGADHACGNNATDYENQKCTVCGKAHGCTATDDCVSAVTCTKPATCSICLKTFGDALGHKYNKTTGICENGCGNGHGCVVTDACVSKPTCTKAATCGECGKIFGNALGHNFVQESVDAAGHNLKCSVAGCGVVSHLNHKFDELEGNENGHWYYCSVVGCKHDFWSATEDGALDTTHAWKGNHVSETATNKATCTAKAKCDVCGEEYGKALGHVWVKNAAGKFFCDDCGDENTCKHENVSFVPGTSATCDKAGETDGWQCDDCGVFTVERKAIKAINHANAKVEVLQAATCYQDGLKHIDCPDCGFVGTMTVSKETAHNYVKTGCFADKDGATAACTGDNAKQCKVATCTEKGLDHYVCSICGKATHKESKALGHDMSKTVYSNSKTEVTKDVTCLQPVYSFTKCSRCGVLSTEYKVVKATGDAAHQLTKTTKITATCTTEGGTKKFCENVGCTYGEWVGEHGKIGDDNAHADIKDCTKVVVKTATCTTDGEYYYICKDCSAHLDKDGKELAAGKNAIEKAAGHTNAGDLGGCFEDHIDLNGVWTYVKPTCKTNGYWESNCTVCENSYRKLSFDNCEGCKADAEHHDWVMGAIKTEAVCGKEDGTAQTICSVCKTVAKHTGGVDCICIDLADKVHTCADMLKLDPKTEPAGKDILWKISKNHDYQVTNDTYKKPTCTKDGYGYKTCSRCGEKKWYDVIPATICKNSKIIKVYVPATCEEPAYNKFICSVCGDERLPRNEFVEGEDGYEKATGHSYYRLGTAKICNYGTAAKFGCKNCDYVEYQPLDGKAGNAATMIEHTDAHRAFKREDYTGASYLKNFVWKTQVSCKNDGIYVCGACPKCDFVANDAEIKQVAKFHLGEEAGKHTDPNCAEPGYQEYKCTECGESWKVAVEGEDKLPVKAEGFIALDGTIHKNGHKDWTVVKYVVKETCTEDGKGVYGCPYCGVTAKDADGKDKVETVKAGHTWSKDLVVDKAPSCGFEGNGHKICTVCGEETAYASEIINPTGKCTFGTTTITSGNCLEKGYVVYECLVCHKGATDAKLAEAGYPDGYLAPVTLTTKSYTFNEVSKKWEESKTEVSTVKVIDHIVAELAPATKHVFGASEIREATCELEGGLRHTCTICGYEEFIGTTATDALGHDVVCTVTPANCYVDGKEVYSCVRCGKTLYTVTLGALKHDHMELDKSQSVASTCATRGYNVYVCKNDGCGYTKKVMQPVNPANHKYVIDTTIREATCTTNGLAFAHCEYCDWEGLYSIAANHKWAVDSVKLAPTCTSKGVNNEKCSVCGATRTAETKALGHTMVTKVVEADCENVAGILTYCSVCSYKTKFVKTGSEELGHAWGAKVFLDATCEKAAHYESTCARCGKVAVTEIAESEPYYKAALNHKGKKLIEKFDGNCMEKAYELYCCPICGENVKEEAKTINSNAHDWEITLTYGTKEVNCGNYGYVDAKCKICGDTVKMKYLKPEHSWTENIITDDIVYKVCTVCGKMDIIWNASNFTGYKGCMTWNGSEWVGTHKGLVVKASKAATCTEAGELGHIECTVCGTVIRVGGVIPAHTTKEVAAVEATCTTEGTTAGTFCLVCNKYVVAPQKIAAKGHKWVEVPAQDATATKPGFTAGTQCENCKEWKEGHEEIPVKAASLKRTAVLRKTAELLGERVALLNTDDAITITGELVNGFYPVSTADGTGYIHNSYIAVA